ncbi:MAG: hypothetical protein LUH50_11020 [Bacteroides intestinalis]|nr:hypothetical protein [Bacteroides intestinalis]
MMKDNRITPVEIISLHGFNRNIENQSEEITLPSEKKTIRLPYNWNSFRITFAIPNYAQSEQIEYTYTMDGLEKIWYNITNENQVTFRNIPPGEYTFRVKAKLKNQE